MALIETQALCKRYTMGATTVQALDRVSLRIEAGEFVAVMGASGSGKSTFMNMLGCLDTPDEGRYRFNGQDVSHLPAQALAQVRNQSIGFVFQQFHLLPRTTALDNVALPLIYADVPPQQRRERAMLALQRVGLADRALHVPAELSGGQQQRVALARALVNQPALVLADEPTGALDSRTSEDVMRLLAGLHKEGITLVLVTHDAHVARWAQRCIVFKDGQVVQDSLQPGMT